MKSAEVKVVTLEIVPQELGLDKPATASLELAFSGFFKDAEKWKEKAGLITDPKDARSARLELKGVRVAAEKKRKELKADSLRMGKAIDGANNILLAVIVPIEKELEAIENAEKIRIADELTKLTACRTDKLRAFIDHDTPLPNVGAMTEPQFEAVLADAKLLFETKAAAARKLEEEKVAREAEEAKERVRVAAENEELRKAAIARENAIQKERNEAEAARLKEAAKVKADGKRAEAARAKEKAAADAKLKKLAADAKAEKEKAEALAAKKAKAVAAKAAADLKELEEYNAAEKKKADKAAAEERAAREKAELEAEYMRKEAQAAKDAQEKREADAEKAKDDAKKAPDKEKLTALAHAIRSLENPTLSSKDGVELTKTITEQIEKFASWVEREADKI